MIGLITATGILVAGFFAIIKYQQAIADFVFARSGNVTAALSGVTLNSGTVSLAAGNDITVQTTALSPDTGAYTWIKDGSKYMSLNMPFNLGATQTDFSGNGNTGTAVGTVTFTTSGCKVGGCMIFDGSTGGWDTGPSASTKITGPLTVAAWVKFSSLTGPQMIASNTQVSGIGASYVFYFDGNALRLSQNSSSLDATSTGTITDMNWHHVAMTRSGTTGSWTIRFYIDGVLDSTVATAVNPNASPTNLFIGKHGSYPTGYRFNGTMDEVYIFPYALDTTQVSQLRTDGLGTSQNASDGVGGPTVIQSEETAAGQLWDLSITPIASDGTVGSVIVSSNPVFIVSGASGVSGSLDNPDEGSPIISSLTIPGGATAGHRWIVNGTNFEVLNIPFNAGGTQSDISGFSNNGTVSEAVFTTVGCKVGNCFSFDGFNDAVLVGTATSARIDSGGVTMEAWIKPERLTNYIFGRSWNNHSSGNYSLFTDSGRLWFGYTGVGPTFNNYVSDSAMSLNEWHHVVAAYTFGTPSSARLYIDGVQVTGAWTSGGGTALPDTASCACTLSIGHWFGTPNSTSDLYRFDGFIDEAKIYARQLDSIQIARNYADGNAGLGGPTRISPQEHALGQTWDLIATEFLSDGSTGPAGYIDRATIITAAATTLGITTPGTAQSQNVTIAYSCADTTSVLRDLLVEYSINGGSSYASATLVSTSSGSVAGSVLSMVACSSGTSNNSFVWNSLADNVGPGVADADVRIRITAQFTSGPSAQTNNFTVQNEVTYTFTTPTSIASGNTTYDNANIVCSGTTLTVDGTHVFNNLTLQNSCTLTQTASTSGSVNRTTLTITNALNVDASSTVNLDGKGFPAGYTSNGAGGVVFFGGDRSGGSHGGVGGGQDNGVGSSPAPYGSIPQPTEPGSGTGSNGGNNGGGAIKITTNNFVMNGVMSSRGLTGTYAGAAGGSIWVAATGSVSGTGTIRVNGANSSWTGNQNGAGAGGRIAFVYNSSVSGNGTVNLVFQAFGAIMSGNDIVNERSAAGTVYIEKTDQHVATQGNVIIANNNLSLVPARYTPITHLSTFADVTVKDQAIAQAETATMGSLSLLTGGRLQHAFTTSSVIKRMLITVAGALTVDATSSINLDGRGMVSGYTSNGSGGTVFFGGDRSGGSHAGYGGGQDNGAGTPPTPFGSLTQPTEPGSGSGSNSGNSGGGAVKIIAGSFSHSGVITANGLAGSYAGAAGGSVWVAVSGSVSGAGTIRTNGANAIWTGNQNGGGGGGRIAFYYDSSQPGNSSLSLVFQSFGGIQGTVNVLPERGGAGTVYVERTNVHTAGQATIVVANNSVVTGKYTPLPNGTFASATIEDGAYAYNNGTMTIQDVVLDSTGQFLALTLNTNNFTATTSSLLTHEFTNTSTIYRQQLTSTGSISIDATSTIQADGRGLLAGYTSNGLGGQTFWAGDRSGGSHGGKGGGQDNGSDTSPAPYGSIPQPTEPGSGSGSNNGGRGGGVLKIIANNITHNGVISMRGSSGVYAGGAGGSIWIITTGIVSGSGTIRANGGDSVWTGNQNGAGGGGRVSFAYNSSVSGNNSVTLVFQAFGGIMSGNDLQPERGGAGTVYIEKTNEHAANQGNLIIANNNKSLLATRLTPIPHLSTFADITIKDQAIAQAETVTMDNLNVLNVGRLQHDFTTVSVIKRLTLTVNDTLTVDSTSTITADGRGFLVGRTSDGAGGQVSFGGDRSGGSHGGHGGGQDGGAGAPPGIYDNVLQPDQPGSGSGSNSGSSGGGVIKITSANLVVNGAITAGGITSTYAGSAGGSIWITNTGLISGTGTIRVNGANASWTGNQNGAGGGGLLAFYFSSVASGLSAPSQSLQSYGGILNAVDTFTERGSAGIIVLRDTDAAAHDVIVDNNNRNYSRNTLYFRSGQPTTATVRNVTADHFGRLQLTSPGTAFTVNGIASQINSGVIINSLGGGFTVGSMSITTTTMPSAELGQAYSESVFSTGGYGPHTFVCRSGGLTVACTTVLPAGLDMNSAGVVSGTPTIVGTTLFTVRATESAPGVGTDEETISITVGNAPTAPTTLFSNASDAQLCCSSATTDATPVFSAIFNDNDTGNTAAKYRIQVASDAGFTVLLWNSSAAGTAMTSTAIAARSPNINYGGSALTLGGATYYWRIKFWDNDNLEGPFSAAATFTTSTAPTAPTTLFSNDGSAQTGLTNPVGVTSGRPNFSAIFNDPDVGDIATKYRIQVDDNNDFSSIVWDSGAAGTSMANCNEGARCADIVFGATVELEADETVYFWRIKFFDQSGVESPWSQDPVSTNKFTMGAGGSSQQRIADLQQQDQQQQEQESLPAAPQAVSVEVLGPTTLRYNWLDNSNNETGFRLLDANGTVIADVPAGTTSAQEINLAANTQVSGRKVVAYNGIGQSSPSVFASAVTAVPQARPRLLGRTQHSVTFGIEPAFSSFPGTTAIMYEILVTRPRLGVSQLRLSSEWIQSNEYTFDGIEPDDEIEVRVTTRNQASISTEPTVYEEMEDLSRRFAVTLGVFKKGTNTLPRPLSTNEMLSVSVQVQNVGSLTASNVLISMPLPRYIVYRSGTLTVDGRNQSDGADQDAGQAGANAVSAIWGQMAPNETHTVRFELAFDDAALNLLRPQSTTDANLAQAAANPIINLQVAVSFAESEEVYRSPVVSLEPDVTEAEPIIVPPVEPEPTPEEPVPLPTPEEVQEINELLNQIIQQEVQESGGDSGATPPAAPASEPTTVSSDGPSFNVEVTNETGESLSLTGMATPLANQIQFSGTTSQPFTLVTLIFNNSVTVIVVSDANGQWHTFVSAEQLGIKTGQDASVKIEAIASKGDLRSERVQVGDVKISLGRSGDIEAEFDTTVSSNNVVTAINEVRKEVVRVIEDQQPAIQTTLSVTAPVVVVSSVPLWGYLPYVPTMIYHFITYLLGLIGRKKKGQQRLYGVVYDSITKLPLPLAIVRIYSLVPPVVIPSEAVAEARPELVEGGSLSQVRKLVSTTVTDKLGRYEALLAPGKYTLEVTKPTYQFPSQIVTTAVDANFHIYKSQDGMTIGEQGDEITVPDVPLDPVNAQRQWQLSGGVKKVWMAVQKVGNYLAVPVLLVGSIASVVTVAAVPDKGVNWLLAIMYVLLLAAQLRLRPKLIKAWGVVYDIATNAVLPLTTIQLIDPQYGKVVTSRLSDYEGRFSFLPEPGSYVIKASKPGYSQITEVVEAPQTNRQPMMGELQINKPDERISGDLAMKQVS